MWRDRVDAGRELAEALKHYAGPDAIVIGVPRGGVVVAAEVADLLDAPLDIVVPRKIGAPGNPELAIGAVAGDIEVLNRDLVDTLRVGDEYLEHAIASERQEIERRSALYRQGMPPLVVKDKLVLLVDDGIATGSTTTASARYLKKQSPKRLVLAVPVAPRDAVARLKREVDEFVALATPDVFFAVGQFYGRFEQTQDQEVIDILRLHRPAGV